MKKLTIVAMSLAFLVTAGLALANGHSWNGYHWAGSGERTPAVVDQTSSDLYEIPAAVAEWAALGTPIQPVTATSGEVTVKEGFSPFWYGLAQVFVEDGHITKGVVKLNTRLLESEGPAAADHVLCQELGHIWGLDHLDGATCMNDSLASLGNYTAPNSADRNTLNEIYAHADSSSAGGDGGGGSGGGPPCEKNPSHPKCQSGNGHWVTVHVFPVS